MESQNLYSGRLKYSKYIVKSDKLFCLIHSKILLRFSLYASQLINSSINSFIEKKEVIKMYLPITYPNSCVVLLGISILNINENINDCYTFFYKFWLIYFLLYGVFFFLSNLDFSQSKSFLRHFFSIMNTKTR